MPKVSVIVPVYNVERYIERCAMSLFKQTLNDVEYIFID
ncbi:MAG: glycosyltransferase, partial [Sodaliphilus sp.]|nr:glycosyltransferase [Sodaliphilus sp.]